MVIGDLSVGAGGSDRARRDPVCRGGGTPTKEPNGNSTAAATGTQRSWWWVAAAERLRTCSRTCDVLHERGPSLLARLIVAAGGGGAGGCSPLSLRAAARWHAPRRAAGRLGRSARRHRKVAAHYLRSAGPAAPGRSWLPARGGRPNMAAGPQEAPMAQGGRAAPAATTRQPGSGGGGGGGDTSGAESGPACLVRAVALAVPAGGGGGGANFASPFAVSGASFAAGDGTPRVLITPPPASAIRISRIYYNSPGPDTATNQSLNAEFVRLKNTSRTAQRRGWRISDLDGHAYRFGALRLRPGASVTVHSGHGRDTPEDCYWSRRGYVWDNARELVRVHTSRAGWPTSAAMTTPAPARSGEPHSRVRRDDWRMGSLEAQQRAA